MEGLSGVGGRDEEGGEQGQPGQGGGAAHHRQVVDDRGDDADGQTDREGEAPVGGGGRGVVLDRLARVDEEGVEREHHVGGGQRVPQVAATVEPSRGQDDRDQLGRGDGRAWSW